MSGVISECLFAAMIVWKWERKVAGMASVNKNFHFKPVDLESSTVRREQLKVCSVYWQSRTSPYLNSTEAYFSIGWYNCKRQFKIKILLKARLVRLHIMFN